MLEHGDGLFMIWSEEMESKCVVANSSGEGRCLGASEWPMCQKRNDVLGRGEIGHCGGTDVRELSTGWII